MTEQDFKRRLIRFSVSEDFLIDGFKVLSQTVFSQIIPVKVEFDYPTHVFTYTAIYPEARAIKEGEWPPEGTWEITKLEDGGLEAKWIYYDAP